MGLQNASIAVTPTSLSVTGGTAKTFAITGEEVKGGIVLVDTSQSDPRLRMKIIVRSKAGVLQQDGTYTPERRWVTFRCPVLQSDGTVKVDTYRYEAVLGATQVSTVELGQRLTFCQQLFDSDFESFHTTGSLY